MGYPSSIYSDVGGHVQGRVGELSKGGNINHITTLTHATNVERFTMTLKSETSDRIR